MKVHELFPDLVRAMRKEYEGNAHGQNHGGFAHDLMVASLAIRIAPDPRTGRLAAAAGLLHSADHLIGKRSEFGSESEGGPEASFTATGKDVENFVRRLLSETTTLMDDERDEVVDIVLHHEGVNKETNSPLFITLVDADRLANMQATLPMRGARFSSHLPLVDPVHFENDPDATYRNPKSVLWDVANSMGWANETGPYILRLPEARHLGKKYAKRLRAQLDWIREDYEDAGLIPYPEL